MDNTLLNNPDAAFAHAFLERFEAHFAQAGIVGAARRFRHAIRALSAHRDGDSTNTQLILQMLGTDLSFIKGLLGSFYTDIYPSLQACVTSVKGATDIIYRLRELDYVIAIATNPIYPEIAIKQRLEWAGLPLEDDLYRFITSSDNMHFAKPDPAYYAEILGRIGVEPDEAIMVGDSVKNDIVPAQTVGLHTFRIGNEGLNTFLRELGRRDLDLQAMMLRPNMVEPQFRGNIGAIFGFLDTVEDDSYWHQHPDPNEWSIIQILCHLVTSEEENERKRLEVILQQDNPFITQPEQPGLDIDVCADEGYSVAHEFMAARQKTIQLIKTFTSEDWQRPARHSIFGLTTMLEMAYFTAQHDRLHLNQLCQTIGRCE